MDAITFITNAARFVKWESKKIANENQDAEKITVEGEKKTEGRKKNIMNDRNGNVISLLGLPFSFCSGFNVDETKRAVFSALIVKFFSCFYYRDYCFIYQSAWSVVQNVVVYSIIHVICANIPKIGTLEWQKKLNM